LFFGGAAPALFSYRTAPLQDAAIFLIALRPQRKTRNAHWERRRAARIRYALRALPLHTAEKKRRIPDPDKKHRGFGMTALKAKDWPSWSHPLRNLERAEQFAFRYARLLAVRQP